MLRSTLAAAFSLFLPIALAAAQAPQPANTYDTVLALIAAERFDEARAAALAPAKTERARNLNAAFVEALILKRQGRYEEAATAFRAILANHPNFDAVRGELAHTLYLMGDDSAATHQFDVLAAAAGNPGQRNIYETYLAAIEGRRPFTWGAYVSLAPSTNLNGGTEDGTVLVGGVPFETEKRKSGVGLAYGVSGAYRFDLADERQLIFGASVNGKVYGESRYDQTTFQAFAEHGKQIGPWRLGFGLGGEWRLGGWTTTRWGLGPQVTLRRSFGRAGTLLATASWRALQYQTDTVFNGSETNVALRYSYAFTPATTMAVGLAVVRRLTEMSLHNYTAVRPSVELVHEFRNGLIGDAALSYEMRRHDSDYFLLSEPRRDDILSGTLGVTFRQYAWNGFAPRLEYSFEIYNSNSERGDTVTHGAGITLSKRY